MPLNIPMPDDNAGKHFYSAWFEDIKSPSHIAAHPSGRAYKKQKTLKCCQWLSIISRATSQSIMLMENSMRPFLRWAGGKRWLADNSAINAEKNTRLVEPFLGGGALFFARDWDRALLSDVNRFLVNAYLNLKSYPAELFSLVQFHFDRHSRDYYYDIRKRLGHITLQDAADFIYLNRACFNGLFRVNLNGRFNVPLGTKVYELREAAEFEAWSHKLSTADIKLADFEETIASCGQGDLIFADPPYTVNHNSNGFIEYNEKIQLERSSPTSR